MNKYIYQGTQPFISGSIALAKGDEVDLDSDKEETKVLLGKGLLIEKPKENNITKPQTVK